jgi:hypothetical protein
MKQAKSKFIGAAILMLLAACNKEPLPGTVTGPVNSSAANGPNDSRLVSRIYLMDVLPAGPDTTTEVTLKYDLLGRLTYTTTKDWHRPNAVLQYVSYFYNGTDTLPAGIMHYYGASLTKTVFNNYVNGLLKSDSSLSYSASGALSQAASTVFLTGASLIKSRTTTYRISNGVPSTVFFRDSLIGRIMAKDNNNNPLSFITAWSDNPFPGWNNPMFDYSNTFDAGINPLYHYITHGNTAFDPVSPFSAFSSDEILKLLAATNWYPKNTYLNNVTTFMGQNIITGNSTYTTFTNQHDTAGRVTVIDRIYTQPSPPIVAKHRFAFVYQYP